MYHSPGIVGPYVIVNLYPGVEDLCHNTLVSRSRTSVYRIELVFGSLGKCVVHLYLEVVGMYVIALVSGSR